MVVQSQHNKKRRIPCSSFVDGFNYLADVGGYTYVFSSFFEGIIRVGQYYTVSRRCSDKDNERRISKE
jgi:hypothetical protein